MAARLTERLDAAWSACGDPQLCVAFSGGRDSTALLHALAAIRGSRALRALHVDHGLHPDSATWADACAALCDRLQVPLATVRVQVDARGEGPEAAARHARYAAFEQALGENEWLVTAHHREDQVETVLLKLLRGAGPHGLGGMRERRPLGRGQLWRPLLDTPRAALATYAQVAGLDGIEDPANRDPDMARSYLRQEILPLLQRHWPHAAQSLAHAARLQREQADFLDLHAEALLTTARGGDGSLDAGAWVSAHPALRARTLELWLHGARLPAPTHAQRHELERQVREAAADRVPRVAWPGAEVRLWRGRLFAMAPLPAVPVHWETAWRGETLALPAGRLCWSGEVSTEAATPTLHVRLDVHGLRLKPFGDRHTRALRDLFQKTGVPPWQRRFCPILYDSDDRLLAVADRWNTEDGEALFARLGRRPRWTPPT
jgi:tRNA(Ile)-lysidine synthase